VHVVNLNVVLVVIVHVDGDSSGSTLDLRITSEPPDSVFESVGLIVIGFRNLGVFFLDCVFELLGILNDNFRINTFTLLTVLRLAACYLSIMCRRAVFFVLFGFFHLFCLVLQIIPNQELALLLLVMRRLLIRLPTILKMFLGHCVLAGHDGGNFVEGFYLTILAFNVVNLSTFAVGADV